MEKMKGKFIFFWNNRNARRKQSGSVIWWFNEFLKEDGVRDTDTKYQQEVDQNMRNLLKCVEEDYQADILHISEIGIEKRIDEITSYLNCCTKIEE